MTTTRRTPVLATDEAAIVPAAPMPAVVTSARPGVSWVSQAAAENRALRADRDRLASAYRLLSAEFAELLAHARASVALRATARSDGQVDGLAHLRGYLDERGQMPDPGIPASTLLSMAFARTADADSTAELVRQDQPAADTDGR